MNHVKVSSWSNIGSWMPKTAWGMFKDLGHFPTSTSADLQGASLIQPPSVEVWQPGKPLWQRWMCGQLYVTNRFNVRQKEKGGSGFVGQMQVSVFPGLQTTSRWKIYTWTLLPFAWIQYGKPGLLGGGETESISIRKDAIKIRPTLSPEGRDWHGGGSHWYEKCFAGNLQQGDSWMYPYQHTPMGNPYIADIYGL